MVKKHMTKQRTPVIGITSNNKDRSTFVCAQLILLLGDGLLIDPLGKALRFATNKDTKKLVTPTLESVFRGKDVLRQIYHAENFSILSSYKDISTRGLDNMAALDCFKAAEKYFDCILINCGYPYSKIMQSRVFKSFTQKTINIDNIKIPEISLRHKLPLLEIHKRGEKQLYKDYVTFWENLAEKIQTN